MLSRFRRSNSKPSDGGGNSNSNLINKNSSDGGNTNYRRFNSSPSSSGITNSTDLRRNNDDTAEAALHELRDKIDRLEILIDKTQQSVAALEEDRRMAATADIANKKSGAESINNGNFDVDETANIQVVNNKKNVKNAENCISGSSNNKELKSSQPKNNPSSSKMTVTTANFAPISKNDENEIIELIRRIAELVVLSERRAGQILSDVASAAPSAAAASLSSSIGKRNNKRNSKTSNSGNSSSDGDGGENSDNDSHDEIGREESTTMVLKNEDAALPHLAPFELFCERNVLANIVNIVTGVAFAAAAATTTPTTTTTKKSTINSTAATVNAPDAVAGGASKSNIASSSSSSSSVVGRDTAAVQSKTTTQKQQQQQQIYYLPPISIATQAIQSVSILIQNVSRATSLYLLLSNNRVNDLIRLPLDLYKLAEWDVLHASSSSGKGGGNKKKQQQQQDGQQRVNLATFTSPEIGELTTHFVSFLKSLAMRVNSETLQFFLSFPVMVVVGSTSSSSSSSVVAAAASAAASSNSDGTGDGLIEKMVIEGDGQVYDDEKESSGETADTTCTSEMLPIPLPEEQPTNTPPPPPTSTYAEHRQTAYMEQRQNVDFPLYARALEFCAPEQDSFVRVTAMNVCMNIIRLATVEQSGGVDDDDGSSTHCTNEVPTGALHEAVTLPLQDRIAIAQYACHPRRVSELVSPLCSRLTSQFGQVEGAVRALEELNDATFPDIDKVDNLEINVTPERNNARKTDETRDRLTNHIRDLIANVQDELLLLDDLLRVGLISLNEQAIEMMLATFVYPMLLQPLLLPLHRFSSSKTGSSTSQVEASPKRARKPTITLHSPPPFSPKKTADKISYQLEKKATISSSEPENSSSDNTSNVKDLHSSEEMDLAPSKTALFGLSVIFHAVSNPTFCHLLLTALLHPLSPQSSGGLVIICPPQITLPCQKEEESNAVYTNHHSKLLEIRMEENQIKLSKRNEEFQQVVPVYNFGTEPVSTNGDEENECKNDDDDATNTCIFILAPALVDMLRNHTGLVRANLSNKMMNLAERKPTPTRPNPYRSILISAMNGLEEMVSLQALAIAAVQSALQSVAKSIFKRILFASKQLNECNHNDQFVAETLRSLCHSVVNKAVTYDGWWKVKFNTVAARILMDVVSDEYDSLRFVNDMMSDIRVEAAEYLMTLPSEIDAKARQVDSPNQNIQNKQHIDSWLLDRFYFDQPDKATNGVVENICYLKEKARDSDSKEQYRYGLKVLSTISVMGSTDILCESSRVVENMLVSESSGNTPFRCAASWALACLYLDAFCIKIAKLKASLEDQPDKCLSPQRQLSYISACTSDDEVDSDLSMSLAHVSSKFSIAMLDETESSDSGTGDAPAHGSVVGLIGKAAFPCVCEVSPSFSNLFTGRTCVLNEGIQWQSLYLVVVGKWAVLAEPERGGSGGEGRVITSCRLSCLTLRKDTTALTNSSSPARRLLVAHSSLDPRLPSLFLLDSSNRRSNSARGPSLGPDGLRLTRSRMDLWFEDSNAAGHAYKVLSSKIAKARARRGGNIKAALLAK